MHTGIYTRTHRADIAVVLFFMYIGFLCLFFSLYIFFEYIHEARFALLLRRASNSSYGNF
jgi:hypothetical protein